MNRFIKTLIIVNGLIIPAFACFVLYKLVSDEWYRSQASYESESVIVGQELETARRDSLALQGLTYGAPQVIYNSTNLFLPISVRTYKVAKQQGLLNNFSYSASKGDTDLSYDNYFNIIFLDNKYNVIGQLVDKKASITEFYVYRKDSDDGSTDDKTIKNMVYSIGFVDSNKDGKLNSRDLHDLYISDLDGKNLTQVTTEKEVIDYGFVNANTQLLVRFKDRSNVRDEYKKVKFGLYDIGSKTFTELKAIEEKLAEIESELVR